MKPTVDVNLKVLDEEIETLRDKLKLLKPLMEERYTAYRNTRSEYLLTSMKFQELDMKRALLSKSMVTVIGPSAVRERRRAETTAATINKLNPDQAAELLERLTANMENRAS